VNGPGEGRPLIGDPGGTCRPDGCLPAGQIANSVTGGIVGMIGKTVLPDLTRQEKIVLYGEHLEDSYQYRHLRRNPTW
jgi:hypothetical protein